MKSKIKTRKLVNFFIYFLFRSFLVVIYCLPFRTIAFFGAVLGKAYYHIDRMRKRCVNANISMVFGRKLDSKQKEILGREGCEHLAMYIFDLLKLDKITTAENYDRFIEIAGSSHLMKSIQRGNGTIIVTGHFGNFYLFRYLSHLNIPPMAAVIRELDNPYLDRLLSSMLYKLRVNVLRPDGAINTMHQLLLKNGIVITLADQKAGGNSRGGRHGIVVDFFGIPSQTHITAPLLARRTGASIVPLFVIRKGPGRYRIEINTPLEIAFSSDETTDLKRNTRKINQIYENYIMKYPQHWFWLHRRWKNISGLENLYKTNNPLLLIEGFKEGHSRLLKPHY